MENNNNTLKILEVSACGNKQAEKKLRFRGETGARIILLFRDLMARGPYDLISVRDIPFHALKKLQKEMSAQGYRMYIHRAWDSVKEPWRYTCLSVLFVATAEVVFDQIFTNDESDNFPTLRYVAGKIFFAGQEIFYKTTHIPCVDEHRIEPQLSRKLVMLEDELAFQEKHQFDLCISAGDFNGAPGGNFYGQELYDRFCFSDTVTEDTYETKVLDHVFISRALHESDKVKVTTNVLPDHYMVLSDHKILSIELEAC